MVGVKSAETINIMDTDAIFQSGLVLQGLIMAYQPEQRTRQLLLNLVAQIQTLFRLLFQPIAECSRPNCKVYRLLVVQRARPINKYLHSKPMKQKALGV